MGPDTINAEDFDVPQDVLKFSILTPPHHGLIVKGIYGRDPGHYKQLSSTILHQDLEIRSFSLEELQQGWSTMFVFSII